MKDSKMEMTRPTTVIGPDGEKLTLDTIPPPTTTHWSARRKAQVVAAVDGGLLTIDEACAHYRMAPEEFFLWQRKLQSDGKNGLRVIQTTRYRKAESEERAAFIALERAAFVALSVPAVRKPGSLPGRRKRSSKQALVDGSLSTPLDRES